MRVPIDGGTAEPVRGSDITRSFGFESLNYVSADAKFLSLVADVSDPASNDARAEWEIVSLESGSKAPVRSLALDPRFSSIRVFNPRVQMPPDSNSVV